MILSYWEANNAKDGRVDDPQAFDAMWDTAVADVHASNPHVYFEPMNEPFGYSLNEWVVAHDRLAGPAHDVPRGRVVISGTGYNDNVTGVGAAPALNGHVAVPALLRLLGARHDLGGLAAEPEPRIGAYGWRTSSTRPARR